MILYCQIIEQIYVKWIYNIYHMGIQSMCKLQYL